MANAATALEGSTIQEVGFASYAAGALVVKTDSGRYQARRAVSCLVRPEAGDLVLAATASDGRCWVLAVLERDDATGAVVSVDGDLALEARGGRVSLRAQEGVTIASGADVSVLGDKLDVNAMDGKVVLQRLSYLGRFVQSEVEKVRLVAGTFDAVMERLSQKAKRVYRRVEEMDQLRAARIDHAADKTMNLRGKNTLMTAEQLVKVDGEQIHMG